MSDRENDPEYKLDVAMQALQSVHNLLLPQLVTATLKTVHDLGLNPGNVLPLMSAYIASCIFNVTDAKHSEQVLDDLFRQSREQLKRANTEYQNGQMAQSLVEGLTEDTETKGNA